MQDPDARKSLSICQWFITTQLSADAHMHLSQVCWPPVMLLAFYVSSLCISHSLPYLLFSWQIYPSLGIISAAVASTICISPLHSALCASFRLRSYRPPSALSSCGHDPTLFGAPTMASTCAHITPHPHRIHIASTPHRTTLHGIHVTRALLSSGRHVRFFLLRAASRASLYAYAPSNTNAHRPCDQARRALHGQCPLTSSRPRPRRFFYFAT